MPSPSDINLNTWGQNHYIERPQRTAALAYRTQAVPQRPSFHPMTDEGAGPFYQLDNASPSASSPSYSGPSLSRRTSYTPAHGSQGSPPAHQAIRSVSSAQAHVKGVPYEYTHAYMLDTMEEPPIKRSRHLDEQGKRDYRRTRQNGGACQMCKKSKGKVGSTCL